MRGKVTFLHRKVVVIRSLIQKVLRNQPQLLKQSQMAIFKSQERKALLIQTPLHIQISILLAPLKANQVQKGQIQEKVQHSLLNVLKRMFKIGWRMLRISY